MGDIMVLESVPIVNKGPDENWVIIGRDIRDCVDANGSHLQGRLRHVL